MSGPTRKPREDTDLKPYANPTNLRLISAKSMTASIKFYSFKAVKNINYNWKIYFWFYCLDSLGIPTLSSFGTEQG